jgi:hypothetical protein
MNYRSKYTDKPIRIDGYLAELMCEAQARREGVDLPYRFWNIPRWKREFRKQQNLALALLRLYEPSIILKVLRGQKGKNIYSLSAPWLDGLLQEEANRPKPVDTVLAVPVCSGEPPRPGFIPNRNLLSKLEE